MVGNGTALHSQFEGLMSSLGKEGKLMHLTKDPPEGEDFFMTAPHKKTHDASCLPAVVPKHLN